MNIRAVVAWLAVALAFAPSSSAEFGSVCIRDFSPGLTCSGTDVQLNQIEVVNLTEDCPSGDPLTAEGTLRIRLACGASSRYDVGIFLAINGNSAESGSQCLHDYLEQPLVTSPVYTDSDGNGRQDLRASPWWNAEPFDNADDCGDVLGSTDVLKTLVPFRFRCVDTNANNIVDISTCLSWSNGTVSTCPNLSGAVPGASIRCWCGVLDTGILIPGAGVGRISGLTLARSGASNLALGWPDSCSANDNDFAVYAGTLGNFASHQPVLCSTESATSAIVALPAGNTYYLVVPRISVREGSYGIRKPALERPPSTNACVPQKIQSPCP